MSVVLQECVKEMVTVAGESVATLSMRRPVLVVFLRHFGCTFCREALADVAAQREEIDASGSDVVFVHMGDGAQGEAMLERYGLEGAHHVSDPEQRFFKAFELARGSLMQLFGPRMWWRGVRAGVFDGHWVGRLVGDGFQMPGVFLVERGEVTRSFRHRDAADRPDYRALACPVGEAREG